MRRFTWIFAILLLARTSAFAQASAGQSEQARWDLNFSAGFFEARPDGRAQTNHYDDWYFEGRYAVGVGYYWTENFKTEIEFANTGEGSRYVQDFITLPNRQTYAYSFESLHRIQQTSVRAGWQFLENTWVHPYVNGGFVLEAERQRYYVPESYRFPSPPGNQPGPLRPELTAGPATDYRGGVTFGGGAKFYMTPRTYLNTGMQVTRAKPSTTVGFIAGFGIDF